MYIKLSLLFFSLVCLSSVVVAADIDESDASVCTAQADNRTGLFKKKLLQLHEQILDLMSRGRDRNCEISELLGKISLISELSSDINSRYSNLKFSKPRGQENQSLSQLFEPKVDIFYDEANTTEKISEISLVFDETLDIEELVELPLKSLIKIKYANDQEKRRLIDISANNSDSKNELGFDLVYHKIKLAKYNLENKKFFVSCIFLREAVNSIKQILAAIEDGHSGEIDSNNSIGNMEEYKSDDRNEKKRKRFESFLDYFVDNTCMGLCIYPRIGDQVL